jgi:hypothetical protein
VDCTMNTGSRKLLHKARSTFGGRQVASSARSALRPCAGFQFEGVNSAFSCADRRGQPGPRPPCRRHSGPSASSLSLYVSNHMGARGQSRPPQSCCVGSLTTIDDGSTINRPSRVTGKQELLASARVSVSGYAVYVNLAQFWQNTRLDLKSCSARRVHVIR